MVWKIKIFDSRKKLNLKAMTFTISKLISNFRTWSNNANFEIFKLKILKLTLNSNKNVLKNRNYIRTCLEIKKNIRSKVKK